MRSKQIATAVRRMFPSPGAVAADRPPPTRYGPGERSQGCPGQPYPPGYGRATDFGDGLAPRSGRVESSLAWPPALLTNVPVVGLKIDEPSHRPLPGPPPKVEGIHQSATTLSARASTKLVRWSSADRTTITDRVDPCS